MGAQHGAGENEMAEQEADDALEFDRSVLGVDVDIGEYHVTKEEIIAYARALGETNPLYVDEEAARAGPYGTVIAPSGFYTYMRFKPGPNLGLKFPENRLGYMAGQDIQYIEPIRAGDTISARAQIADVYAKTGRTGRLVFVVTRTTYSNQHGRTVLTVESSNVRSETMP